MHFGLTLSVSGSTYILTGWVTDSQGPSVASSVAGSREEWKEKALDDLPRKDDREMTIVNQTNNYWKLFGRHAPLGKLMRDEAGVYELFRAHRIHLELN